MQNKYVIFVTFVKDPVLLIVLLFGRFQCEPSRYDYVPAGKPRPSCLFYKESFNAI